MTILDRISSLHNLAQYIMSPDFDKAKRRAFEFNAWFEPEFIDMACEAVCEQLLNSATLNDMAVRYNVAEEPTNKIVGIVAAGNIPMVSMHDLICAMLCGHSVKLKLSAKDEHLMKAIMHYLHSQNEYWVSRLSCQDMLKDCEAYIATGSNNTARYFEYYFAKHKSIIRKNRTSVAILSGNETAEELGLLASDIFLYFGMGCRNVSKLYVPHNYNFEPLLKSFGQFEHFKGHNKIKNNYDYNLAIYLLNGKYYMSNDLMLFVENESKFSPISTVHYEYFDTPNVIVNSLKDSNEVQCIVGNGNTPFGKAQMPSFTDYADGIDTMKFLVSI
jgi:hypothetical protein